MALKIVWNDILKERTDAIVTTASRNPRIGIGLDKFVHLAAGPKLLAARKEMGRIAPGKVGVSSAFGLNKATGAKFGNREDDPTDLDDSFTIGDEDDVFVDQLLERIDGDGTFLGMFHQLWDYTLKREKAAKRLAKGESYLGEFLTGRRELATRSGIGESTIKHFCSNSDAAVRTTKDKIIALSVAMRLPPDYAKRFLSTCGYSLGASKRDGIIAAFLAKRGGTGG